MEINLFSDGDWKKFEDSLFRALVRAVRVIVREGGVTGFKPPAETTAVPPETAPVPAYSVPEPRKSPPPPPPPTVAPPVQAKPEQPKKRAQRQLYDVIKTVQHRPHGWIDRSEAIQLLGGDNAAQVAVGTWVWEKEIDAVIVTTHSGPPHKGLPGRVHVDKTQLMARNEKRMAASATMKHVREGIKGRKTA